MLKHFSVILILIHVVKKVIDESHLVIKKLRNCYPPIWHGFLSSEP
jgi:hypothetical protein